MCVPVHCSVQYIVTCEVLGTVSSKNYVALRTGEITSIKTCSNCNLKDVFPLKALEKMTQRKCMFLASDYLKMEAC